MGTLYVACSCGRWEWAFPCQAIQQISKYTADLSELEMQVKEFTEGTPKGMPMSSLTTSRRDRSQMSMNTFPSVDHVHGVNGETLV